MSLRDDILRNLNNQPGGHTLLCLSHIGERPCTRPGLDHRCNTRGEANKEVEATLRQLIAEGLVERLGAYYFRKESHGRK